MTLVYRAFRYASGRVAAGQAVQVARRGSDVPLLSGTTDAQGALTFELAPGSYDYLALGIRVPFDVTAPGGGGGGQAPDLSGLVTDDALTSALGALAVVARSGAYGDLDDLPTIPTTAGQVGADPAGTAAAVGDQARAYTDALGVDLRALAALAEESDDIAALTDVVRDLAARPADVTQAELDAEAQARQQADQDVATQAATALGVHRDRADNPHGVTKAQVGLGSVPNVDTRPRSTHSGTQPASTVTGLAAVATSGAKADVGLGQADNTPDSGKPVSTAQATADAAARDAAINAAAQDATSKVNAASAEDRKRANHSGTQGIDTVTNLQTALEARATFADLTRVRDEGIALPRRTMIDFVGAGVTATDDPDGGKIVVTIPGGGGGGGALTSASAVLAQDLDIAGGATTTVLSLNLGVGTWNVAYVLSINVSSTPLATVVQGVEMGTAQGSVAGPVGPSLRTGATVVVYSGVALGSVTITTAGTVLFVARASANAVAKSVASLGTSPATGVRALKTA